MEEIMRGRRQQIKKKAKKAKRGARGTSST